MVGCLDTRGRVLLVWQTGGPFAGQWVLPGGRVARDEGVLQAARREMREETGLELARADLVAVYQVMSVPPGAFDIVLFMYRGAAEGEPRAEDGSEARWADPAEAGLRPPLRLHLADLG
ncbi:MAG: NUDIX hydrolase, partial [Candidatus Limnocylindria bacterium]